MPKAIYIQARPTDKRRTRVVLSEADAEAYVRSQKCNHGWLRREFKDTDDRPTHKLLGTRTLVSLN